jgi:hypothetical protein
MRISCEVDVKQSYLPAFHATHVGTACQRDLSKIAIHGLVLLQCQLSDVSPILCSYERKRAVGQASANASRRLPQSQRQTSRNENMPGLHRLTRSAIKGVLYGGGTNKEQRIAASNL